MKTVLNWLRNHSLRLLGVLVILAAVILLWLGQVSVDQAAAALAGGCGLLGVASKIDRAILAAVAQSGADYRAGDKAAAVTDLKPLVYDVARSSLSGAELSELVKDRVAPQLTLTLSGDQEHVLSAASAIQAAPKVQV